MRLNIHEASWVFGIGIALIFAVLFERFDNPLSIVGIIFVVRGILGLVFVERFVKRRNF